MIAKESIYLDSTASSHMTNKVDWLEDYEDIQGAVKVGNGVKLDIKGKGSLPLSIETDNGTVEYKAANVLYVPELSDTLISIGEIAREGHTATFEGNAVKVQLDSGDSFKVERKQGMYALNAVPRTIDEQALVSKTDAIDKGMLWHHRLGLPRQNVTRQLGVNVLETKCKACKMAKS